MEVDNMRKNIFLSIISLIILFIIIFSIPAEAKDYNACSMVGQSILYISPKVDAQHRENNICDYMQLPVDFRRALGKAGVKIYSFSEEEAGYPEKIGGLTNENITECTTTENGNIYKQYTQNTYAEVYNLKAIELHDNALLHEIGHCFDDTYAGGYPATLHYAPLSDMQEWRDIYNEEYWQMAQLNRNSHANVYSPCEALAETFSAVISKPCQVSSHCPKAYRFIIKHMMEYIKYYS